MTSRANAAEAHKRTIDHLFKALESTRPYQTLPFQWWLRVMTPDRKVAHRGFPPRLTEIRGSRSPRR